MTTTTASSLEQRLKDGRFVMTAEVVPPISCDADDLLKKALPLKGLADAVNVTDGAGARAHMSAVASATILKGAGIEPILQLVCRDRNRIGLQSDLMGAAALGIRNILILGGDKPTAGDQPDAKAVFDLDSRSLSQTAHMIGQGKLPTGTAVANPKPFLIGAADAPIDPKPDWQPTGLKAKIDAGATFAQTQFCMDAGVIRRYVARLTDAGILPGFHMIIGINPLRSAKSGNWMRNNLFGTIIADSMIERMEKATDPAAEGRRICVEYMEELATIPGIAGVHIMAPGNDAAVPDVIREARSKIARAA
ncbi:MAG TPA: methylenetetrahydrofolate reductase [Xanthobacteraceae bacterium]|nr:methylenetetrahydrofolate reductase [Xanthobacteraceae bacterium]